MILPVLKAFGCRKKQTGRGEEIKNPKKRVLLAWRRELEGTQAPILGCELAMNRVGKEERKQEAIEERMKVRQARWEEKGSRAASSNQ